MNADGGAQRDTQDKRGCAFAASTSREARVADLLVCRRPYQSSVFPVSDPMLRTHISPIVARGVTTRNVDDVTLSPVAMTEAQGRRPGILASRRRMGAAAGV